METQDLQDLIENRIGDLKDSASNIYGNPKLRNEIMEKIELLEKFRNALFGW